MALVTRRSVVALAAGGSSLLAACRTGGPTGQARREAVAEQSFTLEMHVPFSPEQVRWWQEQAYPRFQQRFPKGKVELTLLVWTDLQNKLIVGKAAGQMPDVFRMGASYVPFGAEKELCVPIDDRVAKWGQRKDFFDVAWQTVTWKGVSYGVPMLVAHRFYWYRKDFAEAAGVTIPDAWTWEQHVDAARRMTIYEGGRLVRLGFSPYIASLDEFGVLLYSSGGRYTSGGKATVASNEGVWALQTLVDRRIAVYPPGREAPQLPSGNVLATGAAAMTFGNLSVARAVVQAAPDVEAQLMVPQLPVKQVRTSFSYNDWHAIATTSKYRDAAWELIAFTAEPDTMVEMDRFTYYPPSRKSAVEKAEWLQTPYGRKALAHLNDQSRAYPFLPASTELAAIANREIAAALHGEKSVREALQTWAQEWDVILAREGWKE
ncbi:MAG: hypothetical protein C4289_01845 [Chloroflexota bacterium]